MLRLLDDHPTASLWLIAAVQASFMLSFNALLRMMMF